MGRHLTSPRARLQVGTRKDKRMSQIKLSRQIFLKFRKTEITPSLKRSVGNAAVLDGPRSEALHGGVGKASPTAALPREAGGPPPAHGAATCSRVHKPPPATAPQGHPGAVNTDQLREHGREHGWEHGREHGRTAVPSPPALCTTADARWPARASIPHPRGPCRPKTRCNVSLQRPEPPHTVTTA